MTARNATTEKGSAPVLVAISPSDRPHASAAFRSDIQGLRAVAVLAVIANHIAHRPSGGFAGVDVFFVVSGYLITGMLLAEVGRSGRIGLANFARRRIRRIVPAASLTLVVTVAAAFALFSPLRAVQVSLDAAAAAAVGSNWRFAAIGTDYFQSAGPESPLQHYWSLSVEEQFYLVWPFVLVAVVTVCRRRGWNWRRGAGGTMGALILASMAWAFHDLAMAPTLAYFSTLSRAWELMVGGLLALMGARLALLDRRLRGWLGAAGLMGLLVSFIVSSSATPFPVPWGLLPVLSTAAVLAAGCGGTTWSVRPISIGPMVYIGDLSYSLYLWHLPVYVLAGAYGLFGGRTLTLLTLLLTMALSMASYHLVEHPVRRSVWLLGTAGPRDGGHHAGHPFRRVAAFVGVLALGLLGLGVGASAAPQPGPVASSMAVDVRGLGPEGIRVQHALAEAVQTRSWPTDLRPSIGGAISASTTSGRVLDCGDRAPTEPVPCRWGSAAAPRRALLIGDSTAQSWIPALASLFGQGDWQLDTLSMYGCRFVDLTLVHPQRAWMDACENRKHEVVARVSGQRYDLVIVANSYYQAAVIDRLGRPPTPAEWEGAAARSLAKLEGHYGQLVVLTPPPADRNIAECATLRGGPSRCLGQVSSTWLGTWAADSRAIAAAGGTLVDTRQLFCVPAGCPMFAAGLTMRQDRTHITPEYARFITSALRELLFAQAGVR